MLLVNTGGPNARFFEEPRYWIEPLKIARTAEEGPSTTRRRQLRNGSSKACLTLQNSDRRKRMGFARRPARPS